MEGQEGGGAGGSFNNTPEEVVFNNIIVEKRRMFNKSNETYNGIEARPDIAFGNYQSLIKKNSYFISEDDLIYLCGKHIVSFNLIRKRQNFIIKEPEDESVTCMNFYYGRRGASAKVAVGLKYNINKEVQSMVKIYYASSSQVFIATHEHLEKVSTDFEIKHVCFFYKGKWQATLAEINKQKYVISIFHVEKGKCHHHFEINQHVDNIDLCPEDGEVLSVSGKRYFKLFKYNTHDKSMLELTEENKSYTDQFSLNLPEADIPPNKKIAIMDHCWIKETKTLIVITRFEVYIFKEMCKVFQIISYEFPDDIVIKIAEQYIANPEGVNKKKKIYNEILKQISKKNDNDVILKTRKKREDKQDGDGIDEVSRSSEEYEDSDDQSHYGPNIDDDDVQAIVDDILRDDPEADILIELIKRVMIEQNLCVGCCCARTNGFAVGLHGTGIVTLFNENPDGRFYKHSSSQIAENKYLNVVSLASSNDDTYIAVNTMLPRYSHTDTIKFEKASAISGGDKFPSGDKYVPVAKLGDTQGTNVIDHNNYISPTHADICIFNSAIVDAIKFTYKEPFEALFEKGAHSGPIVGLALCPTKTICGTLSSDKSVKLWNFSADHKLQLSFHFHEEEQAFDIHPLCLQCAIGFKEGLKIYFMLEEDLKCTYEYFSKPCTALKYSEGGHYLAAGYAIQNVIHIMDSYSMVTIKSLNGHSSNVKELIWMSHDKLLLSTCVNGNVNVWNILSKESRIKSMEDRSGLGDIKAKNDKDLEHFIQDKKRYSYLAVAYDPEFDFLVCCCTDHKLRVYNEKGFNLFLDYDTGRDCFHSVCISKAKKVIIFGTTSGSVSIFLWPFLSSAKDKLPQIGVAIHQGPTTHVQITYDFEYLVTASMDGSLVFSKIKEFVNGEDVSTVNFLEVLSHQKDNDLLGRVSNTFNFSEFCLLSTNDQDQRKEKIKTLDFKIQNTKSEIDEQKERLINYYNIKCAKLEDKNKNELLKQKELQASVMEEADSNQKKIAISNDEQKEMTNATVDNLENEHRERLLKLYDENDMLQSEIKNYIFKMEQKLNEINDEFQEVMQHIQQDYQKKYNDIHQKYKMAIFNLKIDQKKFQEALLQTEKEYLIDLTGTKEKQTANLKKEKKNAEDLRSLNSKLTKENLKNDQRDVNLENLIKETTNQNNQQQDEIKLFNEKILQMEAQLNDQEKVINIKESLIKKSYKKRYHLQNYKSVYDYQVNTLKDEHEPLNDYSSTLDRHVKRMYNELLSEADSHKALVNNVGEIDDKIEKLKNEVAIKNDFLRKTKRKLDVFEHELAQVVTDKDKTGLRNNQKNKMEEYIAHTVKVESLQANSSNDSVNTIMESKKMQSLEKLSAIELQSIKEELLRQRDMMSKKLISTTEINKRQEKERDNVFKNIQQEGKQLINKCNELRKYGLLQEYRIKIARSDADELANEMANNYAGSFKQEDAMETGTKIKERKELPFEAYRKDRKKDIRKDYSENNLLAGRKPQGVNSNQILGNLIKEADNLYKYAQESGIKYEELLGKIHNFLVGSIDPDKQLMTNDRSMKEQDQNNPSDRLSGNQNDNASQQENKGMQPSQSKNNFRISKNSISRSGLHR